MTSMATNGTNSITKGRIIATAIANAWDRKRTNVWVLNANNRTKPIYFIILLSLSSFLWRRSFFYYFPRLIHLAANALFHFDLWNRRSHCNWKCRIAFLGPFHALLHAFIRSTGAMKEKKIEKKKKNTKLFAQKLFSFLVRFHFGLHFFQAKMVICVLKTIRSFDNSKILEFTSSSVYHDAHAVESMNRRNKNERNNKQ